PFSKAHMTMQKVGDTFHFAANRLFGHPKSTFDVTYGPYASIFTPATDSLPHFLSERYCIWTSSGHTIWKAPIYHKHWQLQQTDISIKARKSLPFPITDETVAYYAPHMHAFIHPFEKVGKMSAQ
ncbi:MAG TPA: DUF2071 domain-containing protein, partial [Bacillota bacterium]|nr:DUF2071 domain-containing protein [Bacillota bacterium]